MSTSIITQQDNKTLSLSDLLDEFEKVFLLGAGLKINPKRPGETKKRSYTVDVTRDMVLHAYAFGEYAIGLYLSKQGKTRFCIIDLDAGGANHNLKTARILIKHANGYGIDLQLMRSSSSEGWHLVGFFSEPVSNIQVSTVLQAVVLRSGLTLAAGQCEIYPWPGASRRAVRLPFQPESAWLDPQDGSMLVEAGALTTQGRLLELLSKVSASTTTAMALKRSYEAARKQSGRKGNSPKSSRKPRARSKTSGSTCSIIEVAAADRLEKGKQYFERGLTNCGQLNEALFLVGNYLFHHDPERFGYDHPDEREAALLAWVKANHNGNSRTINAGDWAIVETEIHRMAHTQRRKTRRHGGDLKYRYVNQQRQLDAKFKLEDAIKTLHLEGGSSALAISKSELARRAGVSRPTVIKHWTLIAALDKMAATGELFV